VRVGTCGNVAGLAEAGPGVNDPGYTNAAICSCRQQQQIMKTTVPASFRRLLIVSCATLAAIRLAAQPSPTVVLPDYVTTATRTPAALTTIGTAVDSISAAELARMQLGSLSMALAGVPGAPAFASGASGGVTSLFLRGANSNQTLFLVDGIRANDPNTDYQATLGGLSSGRATISRSRTARRARSMAARPSGA